MDRMIKVAAQALEERLAKMKNRTGAIDLLAVQAGVSPSTILRYRRNEAKRSYNSTITGLMSACGIQRGYRGKGGAWQPEDIMRRAVALNNTIQRIRERNRKK
jgi:hypothetical protein